MPARAGYRFVPFGDKIIEPPVSLENLRLDRPHDDGSISGTLEVTWVAETPVCIGAAGAAGANGTVEPFEIDERGCLPGASLRGMVRSVMEIAGFCHLGPINDHRHFGFRDFTDGKYYQPRVRANQIKAGWLSYNNGQWILTVADRNGALYPVRFSDVLGCIGNCVTEDEWRKLTVHEKRLRLAHYNPQLLERLNFTEGSVYYDGVHCGKFATAGLAHHLHISGYLVVGGAATDAGANSRTHEVFVGLPPTQNSYKHTLHEDFMDLFNRINANPGRDRPEPTGAWRYWLGQKARDTNFMSEHQHGSNAPVADCKLPGIPVFFCGIPAKSNQKFDPKTSDFVMGLSRIIKIPYREGVGDVAARTCDSESRYRVPKLQERFDFARAIFGWLDEAEGDDDKADALAGRVAFSPAFSAPEPTKTEPGAFMFGPPRESFHPFYLAGNYHGEGKLVGRKRYPVRLTRNEPDIPNENADMCSTVSFHEAGTAYSGRIRVHNLHPIEFAALVWCLTFGRHSGPWRHAIGRAKGFGYGRLRLDRLVWARSPRTVNQTTHPKGDWNRWAEMFECWMTGKLRSDFTDTESIKRLRAYANPTMGERYRENLAYPQVDEFSVLEGPIDANEGWCP